MNILARSAFLLLVTPALMLAQVPAKGKGVRPALAPVTDVSGLPRVLLIGDVISLGYTLPVRELLAGKASVHRVPLNCTSSQFGAEHIVEWLGAGRWDVIHFNFGLNDLLVTKGDVADVPLDRYELNLKRIVAKMRSHSPAARIVFATTTPLPASLAKSRFKFAAKDAEAYAAAARKVMSDAGARINDLHALLLPRLAEVQMPETFQFRASGNDLMGQQTAQAIEAALAAPAPPPPPQAAAQKGLRIFSAGHSFHIWVAPILAEIALDAGIPDHKIAGRSAIGGSTVLKHWEVPDEKNTAKQVLSAGGADVLTLSPIWLPDEGIENFARLAVQHNPSIIITVQKYWLPNDEYHPVYPLETRKKVDHDAPILAELAKAQDAYDRDVDACVRTINEKIGKQTLVAVPVGQAVLRLREKIVAGECPGITKQSELFRDSWGHPTHPIMALSAYCHFAVIYKRSPAGLPLPSVLLRNPAWNGKLNRLLQELAWEAVQKQGQGGK